VDEGEAPDWVRDGIRPLADEVRSFVRTAIDFTWRPIDFAKEWSLGRRRALNPLGFLATALAVAGPANVMFERLTHQPGDSSSLARDLATALTPFVYYLSLGALSHLVLRAFGTRRRLRDSCAMALYAGGGPALAAHLVVLLLALALYRATGQLQVHSLRTTWALALLVAAMVSFGAFCATLAMSLGGLHGRDGIRRWQVVVANLAALAIAGFVFALLHPPGNFGLHMVLGPSHDASGWHFEWGLYD
jgi:hypothetical protein